MKKTLFIVLTSLYSHVLFASHGMGGEITWTCDGLGNYIFQVKFYRDCNGIPGPNSIALNTNAGVGTIQCNLVSQTDISPVGDSTSGNLPCHTCAYGSTGNPVPGIVEEFVFQSAPIAIPGTPPAMGWYFDWGTCCRSAALINLANGGSVGFGLRAKMYAYPGFIAGQCGDNSPYFAEKPSTIICTGYPFTYNPNAVDAEHDSLVYSWDSPIDDPSVSPYPFTIIPYQAPYGINNQLPGTPTLNTQSGQFSYNSSLGGYFVTVIKVSAYKCGVLASEIWREINVVLISGCTIPVAGNPPNNPPTVIPPFADSSGIPQTSYDTIVHAGDTVNFNFLAYDFDVLPPASVQSVIVNASGQEFGTGFTNTTTGCLIPPCATLSPPPPITSPATANTAFYWTTTTAHLGLNYGCVYLANKYYFVIKAQDNYCPANGISNQTISITVLPNIPAPIVNYNGGQLTCILSGNYSYQWFLNRFAIPGATNQTYTPSALGYYQVLAVDNITGDGNYSNGYHVTTLSVNELDDISELNIHPNPSISGIFNLTFNMTNKENVNINVKDVFGKPVMKKNDQRFFR